MNYLEFYIRITDSMITFFQVISLLLLLSMHLKKEKNNDYINNKVLTRTLYLNLYIWTVSATIFNFNLELSNTLIYILRGIIIVSFYVLTGITIFYRLTLKKKEKLKQIELRKKKQAEEVKKLKKQRLEKISKIEEKKMEETLKIEKLDENKKSLINFVNSLETDNFDLELSLPEVIDKLIFKNMDSLPELKTNNIDFTQNIKRLHPIMEKVLLEASKLRPIVPVKNKELFELKVKYLNNLGLPLNTDYSKNPLIKLLRGVTKGIHGEDSLIKELSKNFPDNFYKTNITLSDEEGTIELDAIMVMGNNVLTFESKNYSADKIVFSKSGQGMIYRNGKKRIINVVGQLNRHYRILSDIVNDEEVNIYNFFVMTDKKTPLVNKMKFNYLKAIYVNGLSYAIRDLNLEEDEEKEKELISTIKANDSLPLEFTSKNLKLIEKWLIQAYDNIDFEKMEEFKNILSSYDDEKMQLNARNIEYNLEIYKNISNLLKEYYKDEIYLENKGESNDD